MNCKNILLGLFVLLLTACSTGSRFASSFGKRRYTKGYFWNNPGRVGDVAGNILHNSAERRLSVSHATSADIGLNATKGAAKTMAAQCKSLGLKLKNKLPEHVENLSASVSGAIISPRASDPVANSTKKRDLWVGVSLILVGIGIVVLGLLISIGLPFIVFAIVALIFLILGISVLKGDKTNTAPAPQPNDDGKTGAQRAAAIGGGMILAGLVLLLIDLIVILFGLASGALLGILAALAGLAVLLILVGLFIVVPGLYSSQMKKSN